MTHPIPVHTLSRRRVLSVGAALGGLIAARGLRRPETLAAQPAPLLPEEALARLMEGNRRFVAGAPVEADISAARRAELSGGQHPIAAIVSCADSRVPPEIVFDQGLGDLFVCRIAGNFVDPGIAGSVEYALAVLGAPLVMVLGHQECGALKEAVNAVKGGGPISPNLDVVVDALRLPVLRVYGQPGDLLDNAIRANVRFGVERLTAEPEIVPFLRAGTVRVVGAEYHLASGEVELLQ